ncbi:MAG TPA: hypothetical protein EYQ51_02935 [Alphaproteobacteria bacterium]|nr:hypothetical protein [Alphaproteobacteria bacterium]
MTNLIEYIQAPQHIKAEDVAAIDSLLLEFPYYQTAQLLLTKGLLNTDSIRYNRQLKKAAAYSLDRKQLFTLITQNKMEYKAVPMLEKGKTKSPSKELELGRPLDFNEGEKHSFSEWLALSKVKKIERKPKPQQTDLINKFIDKKTTISKPKKEAFFKAVDVAKESLVENNELVTPTLAKVYLEQEHYEKAISAYKKLCLKYPEKNSFFASQIKLINKLKEK